MNAKFVIFIILLGASAFFATAEASAASYKKLCTNWKANFTDAGYGEDVGNSSSALNWPAYYAHAKLIRNPYGKRPITEWEGILDGNGCTPVYVEMQSWSSYQFRQDTKMENDAGQTIYVQPASSTGYDDEYITVSTNFSTRTLRTGYSTMNLYPSWNSAQTRVAAVASRLMKYSQTLWFYDDSTTYVRTDAGCNGTYTQPANDGICIDPDYDSATYSNMDHSYYKFVIGHEFGHRQADLMGGVLGMPTPGSSGNTYITDYQIASQHQCNCLHLGIESGQTYDQKVCLESRTVTGVAQQEGWAFFYAAALFNDRGLYSTTTDCDMSYWGKAYDPNTRNTPTFDATPPLYWNCAYNPRWMEEQCGTKTNRGIILDWVNFYWNVWANGDERFSVYELTNVWDHTGMSTEDVTQIPGTNNDIGWRWVDLASTIENELFPLNVDKLDQFLDSGTEAGVDY